MPNSVTATYPSLLSFTWQILHIISKHTQLRIHWPWPHSCPKSCHKNLLALILSCWPFTGQKKIHRKWCCGVVSAEKWNTKHFVHHEGLALGTSASPLPHVVQCFLSTHWIKPKFLQVNAISYIFDSQVHATFAQ